MKIQILKLFDRAFFKQAFLFLSIVFTGFVILVVLGLYEQRSKKDIPKPEENMANVPVVDDSDSLLNSGN